jgi:lipoate-protein ligase B
MLLIHTVEEKGAEMNEAEAVAALGDVGRPIHRRRPMPSRPRCSLIDLGLTPYEEALTLQRRLAALRAEGRIGDVLLLLQHPPVMTLGRAGKKRHLLVPESFLGALGIGFFEVDRGGDITYHGPGQLVGYPILDLVEHGRDLHRYLRRLEGVLIETLSTFEIVADRWIGRTGVWVAGRKIASIGIHLTRWVTRHGFALNVDMDLAPFGLIVPCGIPDATPTSMAKELARPVSVNEVIPGLIERFEAEFGVDLVSTSRHLLLSSTEERREGLPLDPPDRETIAVAPFS